MLAADLAVSRSVVVDAYDQLITEGYLEARQGSGTRVRAPGNGGGQQARTPVSAPFWPIPVGRDGTMPRSGLPDPSLFPRAAWLRHYRDALRDLADSRLLYPPPRGEPELRAALTAYLGRVRGVRAAVDQVVVCDGVSQGVLLLCRALSRRGVTRIAVEDPCFVYHRLLIRAAGLEPVPVPVDEDGIQTRRLADLEVGAVLLSPAHAYPVGAVLSAVRAQSSSSTRRSADRTAPPG